MSTQIDSHRSRSLRSSGYLFKIYGTVLPLALAAYFLLDRAAAYVHIPGTPLYLGECLLTFGILACASATEYVRVAFRDEPLLAIVLAFVLWGLIRAVPNLGNYGTIFTVRDSALWYYSLFALVVIAACLARPSLPFRLADLFSRFTPWMLVWLPIVVILQKATHLSIKIPGTQTSLISYKDGNLSVVTFIALAAMWLLPSHGLSASRRRVLSLLAIVTILLAATQNRGGLVAVSMAAVVGLLLNRHLIRTAAIGVATILVLILALGPFLPSISTGGGRSISASQLVANIESVIGVGEAANTQGTQQARERQWYYVLELEVHEGKTLYGFGSGPNLGFLQVIGGNPNDPTFRVPHNSHIDVAARLGLIGFCIWVLLWSTWLTRVVRSRRRLRSAGLIRRSGMVDLCIIAVVAILTNAFFDPSLEGAQVAALLWTAYGIGLFLANPRWASKWI